MNERGKETDEIRHKAHKVDGLERYVTTLKAEITRLSVFFISFTF